MRVRAGTAPRPQGRGAGGNGWRGWRAAHAQAAWGRRRRNAPRAPVEDCVEVEAQKRAKQFGEAVLKEDHAYAPTAYDKWQSAGGQEAKATAER